MTYKDKKLVNFFFPSIAQIIVVLLGQVMTLLPCISRLKWVMSARFRAIPWHAAKLERICQPTRYQSMMVQLGYYTSCLASSYASAWNNVSGTRTFEVPLRCK